MISTTDYKEPQGCRQPELKEAAPDCLRLPGSDDPYAETW